MPKRSLGSLVASAMAVNVATKLVTFTLTTVLTRSVEADVRGVGFTFDLYTNMLLFLAREAVRVTNARNSFGDVKAAEASGKLKASVHRVTSTALLTIPIWVALVLLTLLAAAAGAPVPVVDRVLEERGFLWFALFLAGHFAELLGEPMLAICQQLLQFRTQVFAESFGLAMKLISLIVAFRFVFTTESAAGAAADGETHALFAYAVAQLIYGVAIMAFLAIKFRRAAASSSSAAGDTDADSLRLCAKQLTFSGSIGASALVEAERSQSVLFRSAFGESILRVALTEGERVALGILGTLSDRGLYDVVTNLANIFARLVFRMWENACFNAWSKLSPAKPTERVELRDGLRTMLRVAFYLAAAFVAFGPPLSELALRILYSSRWSGPEAVAVMAATCWITPLMAVNGLLEAFVRATASTTMMQRVKATMVATSVVYIALSIFAIREAGVAGLMYATMASMALRVVASMWVICDVMSMNFGELLGMCSGGVPLPLVGVAVASSAVSRVVPPWAVVVLVAPASLAVTYVADPLLRDLVKSFIRRRRR